jgi:hypothetical protein
MSPPHGLHRRHQSLKLRLTLEQPLHTDDRNRACSAPGARVYAVGSMSRVPSQGHPNDAEVVRAAAKQSLAAHGVRLHRVRIMETDGAWTDPWSWEIGVADPAARSVQLRHFTAEDSPVEKFAEAVARKWPWLVDDTPPTEPGPRAGQETIEIDVMKGRGRSDPDDTRPVGGEEVGPRSRTAS